MKLKKEFMVNKFILVLFLIFITGCSETKFVINGMKKINSYTEKSNYKIGNPYKINGQWFYPEVNYEYDEIGIASWYGPNFHGKKTANGETFNQYKVSAAHKTLPLPSIVMVTNLENNRSLVIRINDRGPFVKGRIIDLSKKAAEKLRILKKGTAKVRVKVLEEESRRIVENYKTQEFVSKKGTTEKISVEEIVDKSSNENFKEMENKNFNKKTLNSVKKEKIKENITIQVASFSDIRNANNLIKKLKDFNVYIQRKYIKNKYFYRVKLGPFSENSIASNILKKIKSDGFQSAKIIIEKLK